MFKNFKAIYAFMLSFFSANSLVEDGKLNLTDEQKQQLQDALGESVKLDEVVKAMNQELADMSSEEQKKDPELQDLRQKAFDQLKAHGLSREDSEKLVDDPKGAENLSEKEMLSGLLSKMEGMDAQLDKLLKSAEDDTPEAIITQGKETVMKHSKTHLMGDNKNQLNAFEGRAWNQLAAGQEVSMPTFAKNSVEVQKLKEDMELYHRKTNSDLTSLFRDNLKLPSFWNLVSNIDDRVADGNIVSAEITQARKKGWLPKNKQLIQPEEAQVYPAQVDIEYAGYWLQNQLTSWISKYNKEGSQAYKWTFVKFLNAELDKKRAQEDRIVAIKGVHVPTPENAEIPGMAIHRGDGILIKLWKALVFDKKYKVAQIGNPTRNNILDYEKDLINKNIPEEEKNNPGLVLYMSPTWMRNRVERKRVMFGTDNNYTGDELTTIENFPNIKICPLVDLEGTDFMFITYDDNIELMQNIPGEASMYHIEKLIRQIYIFGDYKWGPRIKHIGTKVKDTDPEAFKVQTVWTNGLSPFKTDFFVRLYDNTTGEVALPYSNITVTNDWETDIETINKTYSGQIVRIKGNKSATGKVVDDGNITLTGNVDFDLSTGGTLTLRADSNNNLTEIKRTNEPVANADSSVVEFNDTVVDANEGKEFNYTGGADTLESIVNGIEGQEIKINGGPDGALTINTVAGNLTVDSEAVLADENDNITFTLIDGEWIEVAREIAAV